MITTSTRPLTEAEKAQLRDRARKLRRKLFWEPVLLMLFVLLMVLVGIPSLLLDPALGPLARPLAVVGSFGFLALFAYLMRKAHRRDRMTCEHLERAATENQQVEVSRCEVYGALLLINEEPGYLFDVGNNQVLYLCGLHVVPMLDDLDDWPNSEFETRWIPEFGIWLETIISGRGFEPARLVGLGDLMPEVRQILQPPADSADAVQQILPVRFEEMLLPREQKR